MKKYIVLVVTTLILTGLAGCSMTKNRYNHYGVVKYLENKYDDKFEYYETYGGTLFDSDSWKKFICTSEKYPGKHILVIYDVKYKKYHDNYLDIKYARQVDELFDSMLSEVFGENTYCFPHYEDEDIDGSVSEFDGDTTFEQYIAMKRLFLYSFVKSDKSNEEIQGIVTQMLDLVGLPGTQDLYPAELSGGMKKRVGLARAIAVNPEIVLYDEPTAGLDPIMSRNISRLIKKTQEQLHVTSVLVTHDMQSAFYAADRVAMLYEGHIVAIGTAEEMKNSTNPIVKAFIEGREIKEQVIK